MGKEVKIKNIVFNLFFIIALICVFDVFFKPLEKVNFVFINKILNSTRQAQNVAPQRLFINAWRIAKIEYVDSTMNNQNWYRWRVKYVKHIKTMEDADVAINSMLLSLNDPYAKFLKSKSFSSQKMILDSKITGVGVMFNKTGEEVIVNHILKNSSAQNQNILPGDKIVSINNIDVKNMSSEDIHSYMEGNKKKNINIVIQRGEKLISKKLEQKEIYLDTMSYKTTKDNISIIRLSNIMGEKALLDFKKIILQTNNSKGLIIDLRNNYGGILANAVLMSDLMLPEHKKIVSLYSRGVSKFDIFADEENIFIEKPIVILVNKKTASSAEILAGVLKDSADAILIGENTYGKNSIQQIIPMTNNSGMIITSAKYILPNGEDINDIGIKPDIYVEDKYVIQEAINLINKLAD
ncbi:MAG: hypothetical protein E7Z90_03090 [Cyanobacteria bacterium SIG29]|nr:hypothetical protein [Cyanobacteria bacterium SIG29]